MSIGPRLRRDPRSGFTHCSPQETHRKQRRNQLPVVIEHAGLERRSGAARRPGLAARRRFHRSQVGGEIAPRVLSRELKALAQFALIQRKDYGTVPPKVEYRLTAVGRSFVPVIDAIRKWGHRHLTGA